MPPGCWLISARWILLAASCLGLVLPLWASCTGGSKERENRGNRPPPAGPSPTATTLVRARPALPRVGGASNDLIPHTVPSTSEPDRWVITVIRKRIAGV